MILGGGVPATAGRADFRLARRDEGAMGQRRVDFISRLLQKLSNGNPVIIPIRSFSHASFLLDDARHDAIFDLVKIRVKRKSFSSPLDEIFLAGIRPSTGI